MNFYTTQDLLTKNSDLKDIANKIRVLSLKAAYSAKMGHPGGDLSCADILTALVGRYVHKGSDKSNADRNRFIKRILHTTFV